MGRNRRSRPPQSESSGQDQEPPRRKLFKAAVLRTFLARTKTGKINICFLVPATLISSVRNFQVPLPDIHGDYSEYNHEWLTGIMEVVICSYMFMREVMASQPWGYFGEAAIFVLLSYVVLLDINFSFVWLVVFPAMAIAFICTLHFKPYRCTSGGGEVTPRSSNFDGKPIRIPVELELIVMTMFLALIVMDNLPGDAAEGFPISQFLLFLSFTVATLTRMVMKLPADAYPGIEPASELFYKTLLLLLLVTAHTMAAEMLGEAVVLSCMPEVVPVLLWFSLHLDRKPGSNSIISVDKMRTHRKVLIALGAVVAALLAYLASSMDESELSSWCMTISVSCGVSGILTYYLVFMQRHWSCPRQQAAAGSIKDDVPSSGMLKLWADALLIAAAALLLVSGFVRLDLSAKSGKIICFLVPLATLISSVRNFLVPLPDIHGDYNEYDHELLTGIMEVVICSYMFMLEVLASKPWGYFGEAAIFVLLSYVVLLDINFSFVRLGVFPAMAIAFSCGVSGILTYYLVFMHRRWLCPRQQAALLIAAASCLSFGQMLCR